MSFQDFCPPKSLRRDNLHVPFHFFLPKPCWVLPVPMFFQDIRLPMSLQRPPASGQSLSGFICCRGSSEFFAYRRQSKCPSDFFPTHTFPSFPPTVVLQSLPPPYPFDILFSEFLSCKNAKPKGLFMRCRNFERVLCCLVTNFRVSFLIVALLKNFRQW